jgi:hypothetical protein
MVLKKSKAWKAFSKYVRYRDKQCFTCGKIDDPKNLDAGHFVHRNSATFFHEWNVHAQCTKCNRFLHGNLGEYAFKLEDKIGRKAINELRKESWKIKRWKPKELKQIEELYTQELKKLNADS